MVEYLLFNWSLKSENIQNNDFVPHDTKAKRLDVDGVHSRHCELLCSPSSWIAGSDELALFLSPGVE